jgi:hypothetical protein
MMTYRQGEAYLNPSQREHLVGAYSQLISEHCRNGRDLYFLTFLFNRLPARRKAQISIIEDEVRRVHHQLMKRIVRKYESAGWRHLRPIFIGSPDTPVIKSERQTARLHQVNDGLHFHCAAIVPPRNPLPEGIDQHPLMPKQSKLHVGLAEHFAEFNDFYYNKRLYRIDVQPVTYGDMADYTLKAFRWGKCTDADILILN